MAAAPAPLITICTSLNFLSAISKALINAAADIATSKIAGLDTALGLKAPLASPTFTGTVTVAASGVAFTDGTQTKAGVPSLTTIGTEISAALQLNDQPWRFFGTYKYAKKFANLEPGYSFIEDFGGKPMIVRSAEYGNTWMESEDLSKRAPIGSVQARANTGANTKYHQINQRNKTSLWAQIGGDQFISEQRYVPAVIEVPLNSYIPIEARLTTLNLDGAAAQSYKTQWLANKSKLDPVLPPVKVTPTPTPSTTATPTPKKITITCVKGKTVKKITAVNPKCPSGYKRR